MLSDYLLLGAIGFVAQLIDGALGMAFGVISTSTMLTMGVPVAQASAMVHTAEVFTTAASAASHIAHRNVDWKLVARLGIGGVIGAVLGAWVLSNVDAKAIQPFVAFYLLLLGIFILLKAARKIPKRDAPVCVGAAARSRRRLPRCQRRRRLGTDGGFHPDRFGSRAATRRSVR